MIILPVAITILPSVRFKKRCYLSTASDISKLTLPQTYFKFLWGVLLLSFQFQMRFDCPSLLSCSNNVTTAKN